MKQHFLSNLTVEDLRDDTRRANADEIATKGRRLTDDFLRSLH